MNNRNRAIADLYNRKREDLNFELSKSDGLVHHHNGIANPNTVFPDKLSQNELLGLLHNQETSLALLGIKRLKGIKTNDLGLDAGCGRGGSAILINQQYSSSLIGISLSEYQIEYASKLIKHKGLDKKISFQVRDMCNTDFKNGYFDFIWACESTEHIENLQDMFREFYRISKPNSKLIIITWTKGNVPGTDEIIRQVDQAYVTSVHPEEEYETAAKKTGWLLKEKLDLSIQAAAYWKLREKSAIKSGTEKFMSEGFSSGAIGYYLLSFSRPS